VTLLRFCAVKSLNAQKGLMRLFPFCSAEIGSRNFESTPIQLEQDHHRKKIWKIFVRLPPIYKIPWPFVKHCLFEKRIF